MSSETPNEGGHKKPPIPTPAKKIPALNIEKRGDRLYEVIFLHKWFAISSILLFGFTVAMVMADYLREWKTYQRDFNRLQIQRTQRDMQQVSSSLDRAKFQQLQQQLQQTRGQQQQNEAQIDKIQKQLGDLNAKYYAADENYRFSKAVYDSDKYSYEEAVANKASNAPRLAEKLKEKEKLMNDYKAQSEKLTLDTRAANADLDKYVGKRNEIQKDMETMLTDYTRLQTRLNTLNPGVIVTSFRNAPVFDFMNPSERINQIIVNNLFNDQPFKAIPRVDRCTKRRIRMRLSRSRHIPIWICTSLHHHLIRWNPSAARRVTQVWIAQQASRIRDICRTAKNNEKNGRRNTTGTSRNSSIRQCCRRTTSRPAAISAITPVLKFLRRLL